MKRFAWLSIPMFFALLAVPAVILSGGTAHAAPQSAGATASHQHIVRFPLHGATQQAQRQVHPYAQGSGDLQWYGGPVQHSPATYVVFWGSSWKTSTGALNSVGGVVNKYFNDMGGTSFENILTQYYDGSGYVSNTESYHGYWIDTAAPPYDYSCGGKTIEDSAIQNEVNHAIATKGWARSANAIYFVYTPNGYYVNDGTGSCSEQVFCAYHNFSSSSLAYAAMAYPFNSGCQVSAAPNGSTAGDSLANVTSHEQFEAITDPQAGNGWIDAAGYEIGDKCAWDFSLGYTYLKNGGVFELQSEYSNATSSCVKSY